MTRKILQNLKSFTLVELMVVIIIIGIIATLAFPRFTRTIELSHQRDADAQLSGLHGGNLIYLSQDGSQYWPGPGANAAAINAGLGINIVPGAFLYSYTSPTNTTYTAVAVYQNLPAGSTFTMTLTQVALSPGVNPVCSGICP